MKSITSVIAKLLATKKAWELVSFDDVVDLPISFMQQSVPASVVGRVHSDIRITARHVTDVIGEPQQRGAQSRDPEWIQRHRAEVAPSGLISLDVVFF
jgi:hypothetical protein